MGIKLAPSLRLGIYWINWINAYILQIIEPKLFFTVDKWKYEQQQNRIKFNYFNRPNQITEQEAKKKKFLEINSEFYWLVLNWFDLILCLCEGNSFIGTAWKAWGAWGISMWKCLYFVLIQTKIRHQLHMIDLFRQKFSRFFFLHLFWQSIHKKNTHKYLQTHSPITNTFANDHICRLNWISKQF